MWWIIGVVVLFYCLSRMEEEPFRFFAVIVFVLLVANLPNPWFWIVGILGGFALLGFWQDGTSSSKKGATQPVLVPAKAPVAIATLQQNRAAITWGQTGLAQLQFFDSTAADLEAAWKSKDAERIEGVLRSGDALNRASWKEAFDRYNAATKSVDEAREALIETIASAEATLKQCGITADMSSIKRSQKSYGIAPAMSVHHNWASRMNIAQGFGMTAGRVVTGNMPWQIALPAMLIAVVANQIGNSKLLRELKEAEGKLLTQSTEMQGDVALMRTLFESRLLPQMDIIISSISAIRSLLEPLQLEAAAPQQEGAANERAKQAALLSLAVAEAQHALKAMAGD